MRKYLLALAFLGFLNPVQAQTQQHFGLQTGANPRNVCAFDTSNTCVNIFSLDATGHAASWLAGITTTPTASTLGGVLSASAPTNNFQTGINTSGTPTFAQPAFSNLSGTAACGQLPALTGDVTSSSCATTVAAAAVTLAKMANLAANSVIGNNTGAGATPIALTQTQLTAMINLMTQGVKGVASPGQIPGTNTNDSASAGDVGEITTATLAFGSALSLTSGLVRDLTNVSLTAGDWDVEGIVCVAYSSSAGSEQAGWVSSVSATQPSGGSLGMYQLLAALPAGAGDCFSTGAIRISLSSSGNGYLSVNSTFAGTAVGWGSIRARRAR